MQYKAANEKTYFERLEQFRLSKNFSSFEIDIQITLNI